MSISSTARRAGPFFGNGVATNFSFDFKLFKPEELRVVRLDGPTGLEVDLVMGVDYDAILNADQDENPGGGVTLRAPLAVGDRLTLVSAVPELQPVDITNQGGFYPDLLNGGLDRATILVQQLKDESDRSIKLPVSSTEANLTLPLPQGNQLLTWNGDGTALVNRDPGELISVVTYGNTRADIFDGDGTRTIFALSASPGSVNNLQIAINGVMQTPGVDYSWGGNTALSFTSAPPAGTKVFVRYQEALDEGTDVSGKADKTGGNLTPSDTPLFREAIGISAPTLAALKAAKVTDTIFASGRAAAGDGYAGMFEWLSGDQYAGVFEDPLQGIWVPRDGDPTGSLGAWKRVFEGPVNAAWFGAPTGGDDAAAFSAAAKIAFVTDYIGGTVQSSLARPLRGYVDVPAGNYILNTLVDTGGRDIIWRLDPAAVITNPENINGQIWRGDGRVTLQNPFGISDYATAAVASIGGAIPDKPAPVTGVITLQQLADYNDRDAVALIGAAYSTPALINVSTATYTATTVTLTAPSPDAIKRLRRGMVIDTKHATRCTGIVSSWATVGSNLVITVAEWRAKGGSSAVTPASGTGLYVNRTTKIWGGNFVANLTADDDVDQAVGIETSTYNTRGDASPTIGNATNRVIGKYVFNAGPFKSQASFMGVGAAIYGYVALEPDNGFYAITPTAKAGAGFISQGYNTVLRGVNASNQLTYNLSSSGNETVGNQSAASTVTKAWRTSGFAVAYDVLETVSGGSAVAGGGSYTLSSRFQRFSCTEMGFFGNAAIPRMTYGAPTGVGNRLTFDTETVTLVELARRVKSMIDDLRALGLYG